MRASTLPWELQRSAPRDVRLTTGGRVLIIVAWLLAAGAVAAGVALYVEARRQFDAALDFDQRSVTTRAVVDRLWRETGDGKPAFAAFHFDANGARFDGEARLQLSVWRGLRSGSTIPVRYLPDDPHRRVVDGARRGRLPFGVAYLASSSLAALALLCGMWVHRQRTLLSEGRPARAVVTAIRKHHGSEGATHREMTYEFALFGGGVATGKAAASKSSAVGTTISVVYDPEQPKRNHPYPFSLVALDRES